MPICPWMPAPTTPNGKNSLALPNFVDEDLRANWFEAASEGGLGLSLPFSRELGESIGCLRLIAPAHSTYKSKSDREVDDAMSLLLSI